MTEVKPVAYRYEHSRNRMPDGTWCHWLPYFSEDTRHLAPDTVRNITPLYALDDLANLATPDWSIKDVVSEAAFREGGVPLEIADRIANAADANIKFLLAELTAELITLRPLRQLSEEQALDITRLKEQSAQRGYEVTKLHWRVQQLREALLMITKSTVSRVCARTAKTALEIDNGDV